MDKLRSDFLESAAGSPTAAQIRTYVEFHAPLIYPHAIAILVSRLSSAKKRRGAAELLKIELKAVMLLCQFTKLLLRPNISLVQLERIDEYIGSWQGYALEVGVPVRRPCFVEAQ